MASHRRYRIRRATSLAAAIFGSVTLIVGLAGADVLAQGQGQGNPPGNNGTVKVNGVDLKAGGRGNDPHVPCSFNVSFWNFDANAGASVSFKAHPPTGNATLLSDSFSLDGDGADGSQDASRSYNLASALLGNYTPHPQQGFHVKLTVNAEGSQGADTKHKVFWVTCEAPTTTTTVPEVTTTTTTPVSPTTVPGATTTTTAAVLGVTVVPGAPAAAQPSVAGEVAVPGELARTGTGLGQTVTLAGAALLLLGVALELGARRRYEIT